MYERPPMTEPTIPSILQVKQQQLETIMFLITSLPRNIAVILFYTRCVKQIGKYHAFSVENTGI